MEMRGFGIGKKGFGEIERAEEIAPWFANAFADCNASERECERMLVVSSDGRFVKKSCRAIDGLNHCLKKKVLALRHLINILEVTTYERPMVLRK